MDYLHLGIDEDSPNNDGKEDLPNGHFFVKNRISHHLSQNKRGNEIKRGDLGELGFP